MILRSAQQRISKFQNKFNQLKYLTKLETMPINFLEAKK